MLPGSAFSFVRCRVTHLSGRFRTDKFLYIKDIAENTLVNEIIKKIENIDIDAIIDSGYLRELIEKEQKTLFPKIISTERPDQVCTALLDGKIVILVENSPFALILPAVLSDFFKSPQDEYQKPFSLYYISYRYKIAGRYKE